MVAAVPKGDQSIERSGALYSIASHEPELPVRDPRNPGYIVKVKLEDGYKHEVDVWALPLVDALMGEQLKKKLSKMSGELVSKELAGNTTNSIITRSQSGTNVDYNETDQVVIEQAMHRKRKSGEVCCSALWVNGDV